MGAIRRCSLVSTGKSLIADFRHGESGLGKRMATGSAWLAADKLASQVSSVIRLGILARFLAPTDFGIMAIVVLVMNALDTFTTPGFTEALIQRRGEIEAFFPSVFTINVLRAICLSSLIALLGPFAAAFFGRPDAAIVIQIAAVVMFIRSLDSPAIANVHRALRFKTYFLWDTSSTIAGLASALVLAPLLRNVWVLLISLLISELTGVIGSYVVAPWRPRFHLEWRLVKELNKFGRWVVLGSAIAFLSLQLDNIVVGRVLGATSLGFYEVAFRISQLPSTQISAIAGMVAFPSLSRVVNDPDRFRTIYLRLVSILFALNFVIALTLVIFAEPIVHYALGDQWSASVPILRILSVAGFIRSMVAIGGRVFYATGRPKLDVYMNLARIVVFVTIVYPATRRWGLEGTSVSVVIAIACVVPMYLLLMFKSVGVRPIEHVNYAFGAFRRVIARLASGIS